jgi:NAD(P)-dependent dehydrogenase (short-subunit alcohol dehydrogenase family)
MSNQPSMQGKIVLITGATNGIGKEAARQIAQAGATVVIAGRDPNKTAQVVAEIRQSTSNPKVEGLVADLMEVSGMRSLANQFLGRYQHLDVLLNNAGALFTERKLTSDGFERTFALNHLSYFVVTNLLLDILKASAPARIVNVASDVHEGGHINFDDLQGITGYSPLKAYSQSKLANLLFTYELATRLTGTGVTVNALHPGVVRSGFGHGNRSLTGRATGLVLGLLQQFRGVDVVQGADTAVYLSCSPAVAGISGAYWYKRQQKASSPQSLDQAQSKRFWDVSESLVKA